MSQQKKDWKLRFGERLDLKREFSGCREEIQLDENGRRRRVMVYYGDYYRFNYTGQALRKIQIQCGALTAVAVLLYAVVGLLIPFSGSVVTMAPELLAMIPIYYQIRGLWTLCTVKEPFEQKVPLMSVRRMKSSGHGIVALLGVTIAAEAAALWLLRPRVSLWMETLFFLLLAGCIGCQLVLLSRLKTFQLEVVREGRASREAREKEDTPQTN